MLLPKKFYPKQTALMITDVLSDNVARTPAFGINSPLYFKGKDVASKTGTTNDYRDAWTIGYTPSIVTGVWVGNNDNTPMSYVASGVTGASPIWNKIVSYALKDREESWPLKPQGIVGLSVCNISGKLPNPDSPCETRFEYFIQDTLPTEIENTKTFIEIDKTTGQLATDKTPPENKELQEHQVIYDPLQTPFCLDCIFPTEPTIIRVDSLPTFEITTPSNQTEEGI